MNYMIQIDHIILGERTCYRGILKKQTKELFNSVKKIESLSLSFS